MSNNREYFYLLNADGELRHDGTVVSDHAALRQFYRNLRPNDGAKHSDYPWLSICGHEFNYLRAADSPIVFQRQDQFGQLEYAPELAVPFEPWTMRYSTDGVLYHPAPLGEYGRISRRLAMTLSADIEKWGPFYCLRTGGREHVIQPLEPDDRGRLLQPRMQNACYGCGMAHPGGPALTFYWDAASGDVRSWMKADVRMQGKEGWMHGGFVSLLLDEVMGKALSANDMRGAPTAGLTVRFRRPVKLDRRLMLVGRFLRREGRKHYVHGEVREGDETMDGGAVLAEAEGLFVSPRPQTVGT